MPDRTPINHPTTSPVITRTDLVASAALWLEHVLDGDCPATQGIAAAIGLLEQAKAA